MKQQVRSDDGVPSSTRSAPSLRCTSPFVKFSLGLHVVAAAVLFIAPSTWPFVVAGILADHVTLLVASLMPGGRLLGPNITRLPAAAIERNRIALTFDDGPDPGVTPSVLDILDEHAARATFFCIGEKAARHPELVAEIVRRGHLVENHSYGHPNLFAFYGPGAQQREILRGTEVIETLAGRRPRLFRPPAGIRNPLLEPALVASRAMLVNWSGRGFDAVSTDADKIVRRLDGRVRAGRILALHDGRGRSGSNPVVLDVLPRVLSLVRERGLEPVPLTAAVLREGAADPERSSS
jgi:peptidoglycan/xylan/chitin deacetylase (PgdA/CDA1 family)